MPSRHRSRLALLAALVVLGLTSAVSVALSRAFEPRPVVQPVRFSHATHVATEGMECLDCHSDATTQPFAVLPSVQSCHDCHKNPQGEHPDEALVRDHAKRRSEIPFQQVTRNPGHVYFSHRMHMLESTGMACETCHVGLDTRDAEPTFPDESLLSMRVCMDCHQERGASNECVVCHK